MKKRLLFYLLPLLFLSVTGYAGAGVNKAKVPPGNPAQFNASAYSGCAPFIVTFYNSSEGNGSYNWNFGDPGSGAQNTSIACSPTHTFLLPGTYTVTLTYYWNANIYTATQTITVYPRPAPVITGTDTLCDGSSGTYTATGMLGSSFYWTAIGGTITGAANAPTVNVIWNTPGVGTLTVTETSVNGCTGSKTLKVLVANQPRLGNFCDGRKGNSAGGEPHNGKPVELPCKCQYSTVSFQAIDLNGILLPNGLYSFQWTVTGGSIVSGQNTNTANILVGAGPTIKVKLVVSNPFGCKDSTECIFDVCPAPKACFKADTACLTGTSQLNANCSSTVASITKYIWKYPDNTVDTTYLPFASHVFATAGLHPVKLIVVNQDGCTDDTIINVKVNPGTAPPIDCVGTVCHHTNRCYYTPYSSGAVYTWTVTGGTGTPTPRGDSICITWGAGPIGSICLTVTNGPYTCGKNCVSVPIFPDTLKIYGKDTICTGTSSIFNTDLIPGSCYSWSITNLGNGNTFVLNPSNQPGNQITLSPNQPGTYLITLNQTSDITCCKGTRSRKIVVQAPIQLTGPLSICEESVACYSASVNVTWTATNGVVTPTGPNSCCVQWGKGPIGILHATAVNPNTVCDNMSSFAVALIEKPAPYAINGQTLLCKGNTATYTQPPLPAGVTVAYSHNPILGTSVINTSPYTVKFNAVGNYSIMAIYTNTAGCKDTAFLNVTVIDTAKPVILGPTSACKGDKDTFTIASNPGNAWQFNVIGGQIVSVSSTQIIVIWGNINQGQITLQNTLCGGLAVKKVTINGIPTGLITQGTPSCKGDTVRLCGPPGYNYTWSNGSTSQCIVAASPNLSYNLIIEKFGCRDTINKNFNPFPKLPKPNVNVTYNCMIAPNTPIPYQMTATYNANWSYQWSPITAIPANSDTTNTHFSTVQGSTHTVVVTNEYGCKDTASIKLTAGCVDTTVCINPPCTSCVCKGDFNVTYDPCTGQFTFAWVSGATFTAIYYNFTDGDYSNLFNPQHWFANTGTYNITVAAWCGCNWVSKTFSISVPYILRPKIKHNFPTACNYNSITLSYKPSSIIAGSGITHTTDWGDGGPTSSGALPLSHTYANPGTYVVSYQVVKGSCTKTVYDTVVILPWKASFGFCDSGCIGQAIQFVDHSQTAPQYPIVQWNWSFGDATTSNLQSPFHIYNSVGSYSVTLNVMNQQGCTASQTLSVYVTTFNAGSLTFKRNGLSIPPFSSINICEGEYIAAFAPVNPNWGYAWNNGVGVYNDTIRQTGTYWCVVSNGKGCTDTLGPFTVIVNPNPYSTIIAPTTACENTLVMLDALNGPGYTFNWSSTPAAISGTSVPYYFYATPAGVYNITLQTTNMFGCSASDNHVLTVTQGPAGYINNSTYNPLCQGDSVQLVLTPTAAYTTAVWSTGQTGLSIWVHENGIYTCTLSNASGCTYVATTYVTNINPRPDLSNIPKGCYRLCRAGGVTVCGPYYSAPKKLYYKWYQNGNLVSNNQNYTITANGNYWVEVTDSATGCMSVSAPFNVQFISSPIANIVSSSPNPTICVGSPGNILLQAGPPAPQPGVIYSWYNGNVLVGTGTSYNATTPGVYSLVAYYSKCCSDTDRIVIKEGDCCWGNLVDYTLIQDSTVYTTDMVWDGKYYVAGRLYVRNNAILDMTEIDVVFARNGEIIFEDNSIIRATNSVFRPCHMEDVWVGFTFKNNSWGFCQANNFKNAEHAVDIKTVGKRCVRLTDNMFSNCNIGIRINRSAPNNVVLPYNEGITHNSFVIDNTNFNTPALYNTLNFFGIMLNNVDMEELVSQNFMRSSDRRSQPNYYYGIYAKNFTGTFTENTFSNMYRAFDITQNRGLVTLENNEMEQTWQNKFPINVQMRITDCQRPVVAFANEFRNSDANQASNTAIYASRDNNLNIRDNNIKGFDIAINTISCSNSLVNENDIDQAGRMGIYDNGSTNMTISCNIIRLKDYKKVGPMLITDGVGVYMQNGNATNKINTNCISDTRYAVVVRKTGAMVQIPWIVNNYMYNYQVAGVLSVNHSGGVGSGAQPGRNTFVCNNYGGGGVDLAATPAASIGEMCNDGAAVHPTVTFTPCPANTMFSSTAACGQRIVNQKFYKLDQWDNCDVFNDILQIIVIGDGKIKDSISQQVFKMIKPQEFSHDQLMTIAYVGADNNTEADYTAWLNQMQVAGKLSNFEVALLQARWQYLHNGISQARQMLSTANAISLEDQQLQKVLMADFNYLQGNNLDASDKAALSAIDESGSYVSHIARDLMQVVWREYDYRFEQPENVPAPEIITDRIAYSNAYIKVQPNPASTSANVTLNLPDASETEIILTDLNGKVISADIVKVSETSYLIDLRKLAPAVYIVSARDKMNKAVQTTKLIKQ